jgi:hypothetical protein
VDSAYVATTAFCVQGHASGGCVAVDWVWGASLHVLWLEVEDRSVTVLDLDERSPEGWLQSR